VAAGVLAAGVWLLAGHDMRTEWEPRWQLVVGAEMAFFGALGLIHVLAGGPGLTLYHEGRAGGIIGWAFSYITVTYLGGALSVLLLASLTLGGLYLAAGLRWPVVVWRLRWLRASVGVQWRAAIQASVARRPAPAAAAPAQPVRRPTTIHPAPFERGGQPVPQPAAPAPAAKPSRSPAPAKPPRPQPRPATPHRRAIGRRWAAAGGSVDPR
jgi:hypothetical protein